MMISATVQRRRQAEKKAKKKDFFACRRFGVGVWLRSRLTVCSVRFVPQILLKGALLFDAGQLARVKLGRNALAVGIEHQHSRNRVHRRHRAQRRSTLTNKNFDL